MRRKGELMEKYLFRKIDLKTFSCMLVYIAAALLAISDSGIQLLILHMIGPYSRSLRLTAMALLLTKLLLTRYRKKEFLILFPIAVLSLYNYTVSGNIYCVYNVLVIAAMKDVDYAKLFRTLFWSTLVTITALGILSCFGIGSAMKLTQNFGRDVVETRYCFGLYHPNIWHQAVTRCIVFFCVGYYEKLRWWTLPVLFGLNVFVYTLSVSRTGLIAGSAFLLLMFCYRYLPKLMHLLIVKLGVFAGLLGVYGLYIYFLYDFTATYSLNAQLFDYRMTTGRIRQALLFLADHPIRLFGSRFPDDGTLFDLGFVRVFYESGYLLAGLFFLALFCLILYALKNDRDEIIPTCAFLIFYSLYEIDPVTRPSFNVVVYFMALLVFSSRRTKDQAAAPASSARWYKRWLHTSRESLPRQNSRQTM